MQDGIGVRDIDVHEARTLQHHDTLMLDVRESGEWGAGHIPGATHIPLDHLSQHGLPTQQKIVAICRSGNRSGMATSALAMAGYDVVNMAGGMIAWQAAGYPVIDDQGEPGSIQ